MTEEEYREVYILRGGIWYHEDFKDIEKGDIFKMFDPDGTLVKDPEGCFYFRADSDTYKHDEYGVLTVDCTSINVSEVDELDSNIL